MRRVARSAVARAQVFGKNRPARRAAVALLVLAAGTVAMLAGCSAPVKSRPSAELVPAQAASQRPATSAVAVDPALFPPGACVALAPRAGNRHQTVFLDPGHGGPDTGTIGTTTNGKTIYERDITLPVALDTAALLRRDGYGVVLSRTVDTTVTQLQPGVEPGGVFTVAGAHDDLLARLACANLAHAAVLVSIHFNGDSDPSASGAMTFYDQARSFATSNLHLARLLQADIVSALAASGWTVLNRGVYGDATADAPAPSAQAAAYGHFDILGPRMAGYVPAPSHMPGALVEPLFITDPAEADVAAGSAGQVAIARGIAAGIESYLGG
jgi:N-acetylmuramoyl-L-alanine amidase